jgi:heme-degrading monooxygenase HmoA
MTTKLIARLHVRDYDTFKSVFDGLRTARQEHGAKGHRLHRSLDDPNRVLVVTEWGSADQARAFAHSLELKEGQERAGVDEPADFSVYDEVEVVTY